jgi:glycosyltransferase involved in cell wall biosynthesis
VFFYPQSVGGATRIFENQVRGLMARYPEEYEIFVLTTEADADVGKPYHVEQYWFHQTLVTKLNVPPKGWSEYEDPHVYQFSVDFFKDYQFDVIHFHSIQVLTAAVVQAALKLKIPYIVTLHDAWWLSIYQFLVNHDGELVDHTSPLSGVSKGDIKHIDWIVNRWRELQQLLSKASAILAVSEKFAQLYQEAGQVKTQVHENYAEPFQALPRKSRSSDTLVLGFIGGMSPHKGYDLFKEALETSHFPNLKAVIVNHSLHSGEVYYSRWGDTPVEFRAKVKQSEVAELYAEFDVLVAPSIWPESYGLVTREALQAGLWVITSNRGAIGDCIIEGVNGNIVSVENATNLIDALKRLPEQLIHRSSSETTTTMDFANPESIDKHFYQLIHLYQIALGNVN